MFAATTSRPDKGGEPDIMSDKLIAIEEQDGPFQGVFQRIMRMVPDRDKSDKNLQRLLLKSTFSSALKCTFSLISSSTKCLSRNSSRKLPESWMSAASSCL